MQCILCDIKSARLSVSFVQINKPRTDVRRLSGQRHVWKANHLLHQAPKQLSRGTDSSAAVNQTQNTPETAELN